MSPLPTLPKQIVLNVCVRTRYKDNYHVSKIFNLNCPLPRKKPLDILGHIETGESQF